MLVLHCCLLLSRALKRLRPPSRVPKRARNQRQAMGVKCVHQPPASPVNTGKQASALDRHLGKPCVEHFLQGKRAAQKPASSSELPERQLMVRY